MADPGLLFPPRDPVNLPGPTIRVFYQCGGFREEIPPPSKVNGKRSVKGNRGPETSRGKATLLIQRLSPKEKGHGGFAAVCPQQISPDPAYPGVMSIFAKSTARHVPLGIPCGNREDIEKKATHSIVTIQGRLVVIVSWAGLSDSANFCLTTGL